MHRDNCMLLHFWSCTRILHGICRYIGSSTSRAQLLQRHHHSTVCPQLAFHAVLAHTSFYSVLNHFSILVLNEWYHERLLTHAFKRSVFFFIGESQWTRSRVQSCLRCRRWSSLKCCAPSLPFIFSVGQGITAFYFWWVLVMCASHSHCQGFFCMTFSINSVD